MIKIGIIGDSHLSALKYGIDTARPEFDITIFSCLNDDVSSLHLFERSLVPQSNQLKNQLAQFSGGLTSIDIDSFDQFVIVGFNLCLVPVGMVYKNYCSDSMPGPTKDRYLLSDDAFNAVCRCNLERTESVRIAHAIRSVSEKPITLVASPNMAEGIVETEMPSWFPPFHEAERQGDAIVLAKVLRDYCEKLFERNRFSVIGSLMECASSSAFNLVEFSLLSDGVKIDNVEEKIGKSLHGNHRYGSLLVRYVYDSIRQGVQP